MVDYNDLHTVHPTQMHPPLTLRYSSVEPVFFSVALDHHVAYCVVPFGKVSPEGLTRTFQRSSKQNNVTFVREDTPSLGFASYLTSVIFRQLALAIYHCFYDTAPACTTTFVASVCFGLHFTSSAWMGLEMSCVVPVRPTRISRGITT